MLKCHQQQRDENFNRIKERAFEFSSAQFKLIHIPLGWQSASIDVVAHSER